MSGCGACLVGIEPVQRTFRGQQADVPTRCLLGLDPIDDSFGPGHRTYTEIKHIAVGRTKADHVVSITDSALGNEPRSTKPSTV